MYVGCMKASKEITPQCRSGFTSLIHTVLSQIPLFSTPLNLAISSSMTFLMTIKFSKQTKYYNVQTNHRWTVQTSLVCAFVDWFFQLFIKLYGSCVDWGSSILANFWVKFRIAVVVYIVSFYPVPFQHRLAVRYACASYVTTSKKLTAYYFSVLSLHAKLVKIKGPWKWWELHFHDLSAALWMCPASDCVLTFCLCDYAYTCISQSEIFVVRKFCIIFR